MVITVASRNHYETLGLTPRASAGEIAQAFAREMSGLRVRPFGGITEVCVAYETLRNPAKREAYDRSIGIAPVPAAMKQFPTITAKWSFTPKQDGIRELADATPKPAPPSADPVAIADESAQPTLPKREPIVADHRTSDAAAIGGLAPLVAAGDYRFTETDSSPVEWKRTAAIAGALVATVAFLGAYAGLESSNDRQMPEAERAATVKMPAPKASPRGTATASEAIRAPAPVTASTRTEQPSRAVSAPPNESRPAPSQTAAAADETPEWALVVAPKPVSAAAGTDAAEPPSIETAAAAMPLPNRTIARTIERIGYACGQVASTTAIAGEAPGVFRVTCTSGQSYQARPVNGRYRFRRLGRN